MSHQDFHNVGQSTDNLYFDSLRIIEKKRHRLHLAERQYHLDDLLIGMLLHAPDPSGTQYVANALHIADKKGGEAVVNIARAWLDHLFLPVLAQSEAESEPSSSKMSPFETAVTDIEHTTHPEQDNLRAAVSKRESYRCAITKAFDQTHAEALENQRMDVPTAALSLMQAALIIPLSLKEFKTSGTGLKHAATTWDMLRSWIKIDITALVESAINSPENAIYMTINEHDRFERFKFYLEKDVDESVPNKYVVRMTKANYRLSNGLDSADVQFPTLAESGTEPPNPELLRVHAAFAKVLKLCSADGYPNRVDKDAETDFRHGLVLMSRL